MNIIGVGKLLEAMRAGMASTRAKFVRLWSLQGAFRRSLGAIWGRLAAFGQKNRLGRAVLAIGRKVGEFSHSLGHGRSC